MLRDEATGTLEIGEPFDAVILNQNVLETDAESLINVKVLATFKSGKEIFRANP